MSAGVIIEPETVVSWWWIVERHDPRTERPIRYSRTDLVTFDGPGCQLKAAREHERRRAGQWVPADAAEWGVDDIVTREKRVRLP